MDVKKIENIVVDEDEKIRVKTMGNIIELMYQSTKSNGTTIRKLSKDEYLNIKTGEILSFNHIENRSQDLKSIAKSLEMGRNMLNANITEPQNCRWVTLTYAENMTDPSRLLSNFREFNKRLRSKIGHYEYITAAEPQGRGAWHLHVVMIFDHKAPFISNDVMCAAWKQGYVTVKRLDEVDNVGAYLTAYLGDMEMEEAKQEEITISNMQVKEIELEDENGNKVKKRYIKGARLYMYPPQFHIFRWSRGVKYPITEIITELEARKKVSGATLTFQKTIELSEPKNSFKTTIDYRYYNSKRK